MSPIRFILLPFVATAILAQVPERPRTFAIRDARIVPVSGPEIAHGVLVVRDGLITAVDASAEIPDDAWVIEGAGLTVFPGFIDGLSTLGMPDAKKFPPVYGKRPASGPEDRPATSTWALGVDHFSADSEQIATWRNGGFAAVAVAPRQGILPGQISILNLGREPAARAVLPKAALLIQLPPERSRENGFPSSLFGEISYVKQIFLDARQYQQARVIYEQDARGLERPGYDRALEPVIETIESKGALLYPGNSAVELRRAVALTESLTEHRIIYGAQQAYQGSIARELAAASVGVLVDLSWPEAPKDPDPQAETPLRVLRLRDRAPSSPAALAKDGVPFGFYAAKAKGPADLMNGLRKALEAGLSRESAIEALTLAPARIYGVADRLGSLEPGKIANLAVYRGDPFEEESRPLIVFVDGEKFDVPEAPEKPEKEQEGNADES